MSTPSRPRREVFRRYPALVFIVAAGALAILLPTALTIPSSGPPTLAEYAPVPGAGEGQGNVSELGQASGGSLGAGTGKLEAQKGTVGPAQPKPRLKRCVGKPPRQTEDTMSPPCVAFFQGNNGGATYQGVTKDEITVLVYLDTATYNVGDSVDQSPDGGQYCDIDLPPNTGGRGCYSQGALTDHKMIQFTRAYSRFFNDRFQAYGRRVHYWVYWRLGAGTASTKRADAEENFSRLRPFAVIDETFITGNDEAYFDAIASHGVLFIPGFGASTQPNSFFRAHAPLAWAFFPDIEHWAQGYVSYVCQKVAPHPVSHAQDGISNDGTPMNGKSRRYGLIYSSDPRFPNLQRFADLVSQGLTKCRVTRVEEANVSDEASGAAAAARMKQADATTLLFAGAETLYVAQAADTAKYYPEAVIAGDGAIDRNLTGRTRPRNFWRNAWVVSYQLGFYSLEEDFGYQACREGDPGFTRAACEFGATRYRDHFLLFKIIQAAGPRLTPDTIDRGMHAIPRISSDDHSKASCFFESGDFTCVKDSVEEWWDSDDHPPGKVSPGCWKMTRKGQRFLPGEWPPGDDVFYDQSDPCNSYTLGGPYDQ